MKFAQPLPRAQVIRARDDALLDISRERTVLHLGFVDEGLLEERLAQGTWLHARLAAVAKRLVGVDLSQAGVERARELGYQDVYLGDVEQLSQAPFPRLDYDVILATDIIEHLGNPGMFLTELRALAGPDTTIVITTPNALSVKTLFFPVAGVEVVHPDHNFYYSPTTLITLLRKYRLGEPQVALYSTVWVPSKRNARGVAALIAKLIFTAVDFVLQYSLVRLFPYFSEGMLIQVRTVE